MDEKGVPKYVKINIKYKNEDGRKATIAGSSVVHHDFGHYKKVLNVTILYDNLDKLERSGDIEWVDRRGAKYL